MYPFKSMTCKDKWGCFRLVKHLSYDSFSYCCTREFSRKSTGSGARRSVVCSRFEVIWDDIAEEKLGLLLDCLLDIRQSFPIFLGGCPHNPRTARMRDPAGNPHRIVERFGSSRAPLLRQKQSRLQNSADLLAFHVSTERTRFFQRRQSRQKSTRVS